MRTTVNIDPDLLRELKLLAARSDRTIGSVLEDALREHLDRVAARPSPRTPLPTFTPPNPGLRPGVDLTDRDSLAEIMDDIGARI